MNKKLRALCKSLKKKPAPVAQPEEESKEETIPQIKTAGRKPPEVCTQRKSEKKPTSSHISESERRRRMISDLRNEKDKNKTLTPYELALQDQKRQEEKVKIEEQQQEKIKSQKVSNSYRLPKNTFNILSLFKAPNGALAGPKVVTSLLKTFKFEIGQGGKGERSKGEMKEALKGAEKEFSTWVEEAKRKKRDIKEFSKTSLGWLYNESSEFEYPCLFRNSRLNLERKNELCEKVAKCEEEVGYLERDIQRVDTEMKNLRVKKAEFFAQKLINQLDLRISGEIHSYYQQSNMERKKKKAEARAEAEGKTLGNSFLSKIPKSSLKSPFRHLHDPPPPHVPKKNALSLLKKPARSPKNSLFKIPFFNKISPETVRAPGFTNEILSKSIDTSSDTCANKNVYLWFRRKNGKIPKDSRKLKRRQLDINHINLVDSCSKSLTEEEASEGPKHESDQKSKVHKNSFFRNGNGGGSGEGRGEEWKIIKNLEIDEEFGLRERVECGSYSPKRFYERKQHFSCDLSLSKMVNMKRNTYINCPDIKLHRTRLESSQDRRRSRMGTRVRWGLDGNRSVEPFIR